MLNYQELSPPPRLARAVECFWITRQSGLCAVNHRVLPDGCADIIYTREGGTASLRFIGAMTRYRDFPQLPASCSIGVRFRPAMWAQILGTKGNELADQICSLQDLWGDRATTLKSRLDSVEDSRRLVELLSEAVPSDPSISPIQKAISEMARSGGRLSVGSAAHAAGLGIRQFRRRCLEETSLPPKLLSRILRFRHATKRVAHNPEPFAALAVDCGYADQSHLIADFRRFSGRTPRLASYKTDQESGRDKIRKS